MNNIFLRWKLIYAALPEGHEALWDLVRQLIEVHQYKRTIVLYTLGLSSKQFKAKFGAIQASKRQQKSSKSASQKAFVNAPLDILSATPDMGASNITLERPDGMKLSLSQPTNEQFSQLLNQFTR